MLLENIRLALTALGGNKLRSALTTLGISIGVAAVIILVSLGQAVQDYVANQFLGIGTNLVFVLPSSFVGGGGNGAPSSAQFNVSFSSLTQRDAQALSDPFSVPDASAVVATLNLTRTITYNGLNSRVPVNGTTSDYFMVRNRPAASGRVFDSQDLVTESRVAVIGPTVVRNLFSNTSTPVGETIRIGDVPFKVIGVLEKYGGTSFGDADNVILVPLTTAQSRLQNVRNNAGAPALSVIYMQARTAGGVDAMVQEITDTLRRLHNIAYRAADDFQILTQKDLLSSFGQITNLLTIFLGIIAGISLLVGGIGIMNIMLVTVTERTREIGLRKAVGARSSDVLIQFLIEATILALLGGFVGMLIAFGATFIIHALLPTLNAVVQPTSVALAIGISSAIGVFFGMYPASRAAALSPIEALRYE